MKNMRFCLLLIAAVGLHWATAAEAPVLLQAAGIVEPFLKVTVGVRVSGIVESVAVEEGAIVKQGDVLAKLDDKADAYEVEHQAALEKLWRVKAEALTKLQKENIESQDKLNEAIASEEVAAAQLKKAKKDFEEKTIRAPLSGIVTRRFKLPGEYVQEQRDDFFEIISVDTVYFLAYFDAKDLLRVKEGQPAIVRLEVHGEENFKGKVYFVDPAVDAGSGQFRVRVLLDNPKHRITAGLKGVMILGEELPHGTVSK